MGKYSAIREMYYGNRGQHDTIVIDDEEVKCLDVITECEEMLINELKKTVNLLKIFESYQEAVFDLNSIENEHYYAEGFRFGFLMAMDIFDYNKN